MKHRSIDIKAAFFLCFTALLGPLISANGQTIWTDGTGDWFDPANWSAGVPNSSTVGRINNGGTAQIGSDAGSANATLGSAAQDSGTLVVFGAGRLDGTVDVGVAGTGTLNIIDGGAVTSGRFILASGAGSIGTATVSGAGSKWTNSVVCFVGHSGTAALNITAGATVTGSSSAIAEAAGSTGVVTIDGAGSTWSQSGTITVGGNGTATLNVVNGGKMVTGGSGGSFGSTIPRNPGASGLVFVSGAGSTWMNAGSLHLGALGSFAASTGTLQIRDGGAVTNSNAQIGGSLGTSSVEVRGAGSTWTSSGNLSVGANRGGVGHVTIGDGATVSNANGTLGTCNGPGSAGCLGTVTVDGAGSTWTSSGNVFVGGTQNGGVGNGVLRIANGGTATANATTIWTPGALELGVEPNFGGALTFSGGTLRAVATTSFPANASLAAAGATVDASGVNLAADGVFSGAGGLTKTGSGTLTLSNANTYSGSTVVNTGRLLVNNSSGSALGSGPVAVNAGALLGGAGTIAGPVAVDNGGAILGGDSARPTGVLAIGGGLSLNPGSVVQLVLGSGGSHSTLQRTAGTWGFASSQTFAFVNAGTEPGFYDNIITGLAGDPGVAGWSIAGGAFAGFFTYDGAGNVDLTLTAVPVPLQASAAASRKTHGMAGDLLVDLPLTGAPGVECRSGGANADHTIVITFNNTVVSGTAVVEEGVGTVAGVAFSGNTMTVNLAGVANAGTLRLQLSRVTDSSSQIAPDVNLSATFLLGDTNASTTVNAGDALQTRNRSGQTADPTTFRSDVNTDGIINSGDASVVRNRSGTGLL